MTRQLEIPSAPLSATVRTRVRLPEAAASGQLFPGWGPGLGR